MTTKKGSKTVVKGTKKTAKKEEEKVTKEQPTQEDVKCVQEIIEQAKQDEDFKVEVKKPILAIKRVSTGCSEETEVPLSKNVLPIVTYKGIPDDMKRLERELKRQKSFTEKALSHFKNTLTDKNQLIETLQQELEIVRKRANLLDGKLKKVEDLTDKLLLNHLKDEELTDEDRFDSFLEDLKTIF